MTGKNAGICSSAKKDKKGKDNKDKEIKYERVSKDVFNAVEVIINIDKASDEIEEDNPSEELNEVLPEVYITSSTISNFIGYKNNLSFTKIEEYKPDKLYLPAYHSNKATQSSYNALHWFSPIEEYIEKKTDNLNEELKETFNGWYIYF